MIHFKKVRWRNVLSYGQQWTELILDKNPSSLILGSNGSGKSVCMEAMVFGLFGKPFRKIKKQQLINTKNGRDLLIEIEFVANNIPYLIRRGMKPEIFEIWENDQLINQNSSSKDYQRYLETNILKMDYAAACQIMFIGKASHTSFMNLDSGKRRQFVEVILNLVIYSYMSKIQTTKATELKNQLTEIKNAVTRAEDQKETRIRYLNDLKQTEKQNKQQEIKRIQKLIDDVNLVIQSLDKEISLLPDVNFDEVCYNKLEQEQKKLRDLSIKNETKLATIKSNLELIKESNEKDLCYACGQKLHSDSNSIKLVSLENDLKKHSDADIKIEEQLNIVKSKLEQQTSIKQEFENVKSKFKDLDIQKQSQLRMKNSFVESLNKNDYTSQIDKIKEVESEIEKLSTVYTQLYEKYENLAEDNTYNKLLGEILTDKGIKAMFIKTFIPLINRSVNANLTKLGLFVKFQLDENFDETIQARGFDTLGYNNFSEGEKLRMDMALLLAWREIAKLKGNVSSNVLFFDEIFDSSLDSGGAESLADLLTCSDDLNIFIITHTPEKIVDKVRSIINIGKVDGFSTIL